MAMVMKEIPQNDRYLAFKEHQTRGSPISRLGSETSSKTVGAYFIYLFESTDVNKQSLTSTSLANDFASTAFRRNPQQCKP